MAALGSLLFGFDTAVISGTTDALRHVFTLNDNLLGFTVSSALLGTMVGSLLVGRPADWWGRRPVLALLAVLFVIAAAGLRAGVELVCAAVLPLAGRRGGRAGRRWSARCISPRSPRRRRRGLLVAVSQLNIVHRHPGGVLLELPRGPRVGGRQPEHLALDVRGHDGARGGLPARRR